MSRLSWTISRPSSGVMFYFEEADSSSVLTGEACGLSRVAGEAVFGKGLRSPLLFPHTHTRAPAHAQKKQNSIDLGGEITRSYDGRFSREEPLRQTQMVELFPAEVSRWRRSTAPRLQLSRHFPPSQRRLDDFTCLSLRFTAALPLFFFSSHRLKTPLKETVEEVCLPCRPR